MPILVDNTPNPNALKFTVGHPVGGPVTFVTGTDDPLGKQLVDIGGVTSVFMTADFVTVTKAPSADWAEIVPAAQAILEEHFGS